MKVEKVTIEKYRLNKLFDLCFEYKDVLDDMDSLNDDKVKLFDELEQWYRETIMKFKED